MYIGTTVYREKMLPFQSLFNTFSDSSINKFIYSKFYAAHTVTLGSLQYNNVIT